MSAPMASSTSRPKDSHDLDRPSATPPSSNPLKIIPFPLALLTLAALASPLSQASMAPVYGALTCSVNHTQAISATLLLGFSLRLLNLTNKTHVPGRTLSATRLRYHLPIYAFWTATIELYLSGWSDQLGPIFGPALTGFLTCHCLIIPSAYVAAEELEKLRVREWVGRTSECLILAVGSLIYFTGLERLLAQLVPWALTEYPILSPALLQVCAASIYAMLAPTWWALLGAVAAWQTLSSNPHHSGAALQVQLQRHGNWSLLERKWSNTGYVSIFDDLDRNVRFMRCDHSLLGGEWLLNDERRENEGWNQNEPIYSIFEMLEAVRLVEDEERSPDAEAKALVIGAGIGTAPKALMAHGIDTTIVELDPVVHEFAMKYFGLPSNHTAILQDAVHWVSPQGSSPREASRNPSLPHHMTIATYDYIIHDVFTGGAEPLSLFTKSFLMDLASLLKLHGVIAINYAGAIADPLTQSVLYTIDATFGNQCKIFSDKPAPTQRKVVDPDGRAEDQFANFVVFCRNPHTSKLRPITFRQPTETDFLGSISRKHYLVPKPSAEIEYPFGIAYKHARLGQDHPASTNVLWPWNVWEWSAEQAKSAQNHWRIMRTVLPAKVWELY